MSLTERLGDQHAQLIALKASEVELTDGPDEALKLLSPPADPIRMRATLGILLRADRYREAIALVGDVIPHDKWIDLATYAHAVLGDLAHARALVDRADDSPELLMMRRTRLAFAEGVVERWQSRQGNESLLATHKWEDADIELAFTVLDLLDPLLSLVKANRCIQGDLQLGAVTYAVFCAQIADDKRSLSQFSAWLVRHVPIPTIVAELSLRGIIECPANLPSRLRTEHLGDFQAGYLAAVADRAVFDRAIEAFDAFVQLGAAATTDEQRKSVCRGLLETVGRCPEKIDQAIKLVTGIRPNDSRLLGLLRVFKFVYSDELEHAKELLEDLRDESDDGWWQAYAQIAERMGDEAGAEAAWAKASELLPHRDIIRRSVQASFDRRKYESAVRGLKKLVIESPDSEQDLRALSHALVQLRDYAEATEYLHRLVRIVTGRPKPATSGRLKTGHF